MTESLPNTDRPVRLAHVITGLETGGAEMMLFKLVAHLDRRRFHVAVISLGPDGDVGRMIAQLDVPVVSLQTQRSGLGLVRAWRRLREVLITERIELVQTWMYHADLLGGVMARSRRLPLVWNVQGSTLDQHASRPTTRWAQRACARLSWHLPARVICCGPSTSRTHVDLGYDPSRMVTIPNAVDLERFKPDPQARAHVCAELDIPPDAEMLGMAARFDPQKDHRTLLQSLAMLASRYGRRPHAVLFGRGLTGGNEQLTAMVREAGASGHLHLLGPRRDTARLLAACDVHVLSSAYGEGLPNAVIEAMACGVPCVVTDVGDSRWVVGESGVAVRPRDPASLAQGLNQLLSLSSDGRRRLGQHARARVEELFDIRTITRRYEQVYEEVVSGHVR